jgi:hypothetical protein
MRFQKTGKKVHYASMGHEILRVGIKCFADNSQEGMKHRMRGATQAQQGMTLRMTQMLQK